jgi:hypothetical protein
VLATGPKGRGFEAGQDDENAQHIFLLMGNKAGGSMS